MGLSVGRQPRRKPGRPKRRDPLVLKVSFPSHSTEQRWSSASVEHSTRAGLDEEISQEGCQEGDELQGMTTSAMKGHLASPSASPSLHSDVRLSTDEDYATVRQANHDLPGFFDLILN
jgi:hypothetical protein